MGIIRNPYSNALVNIKLILDKDQIKRSIFMLVLLIINAILDVLSLASIYPITYIAADPTLIQKNEYLADLYKFLNASSVVHFLFIFACFIFIFFIFKSLFGLYVNYIQARFSFNISHRLSQKYFQYYYSKGFSYIYNTDSGKKAYDMLNMPYYFASSYLMEVLSMSTELVVLIIVFITIAFLKPTALGILILLIFPTFILVYLLTKNKTKALGDERNKIYPKLMSSLLDSMNAYNDVILANKEKYYFDKFSNELKQLVNIDSLQQGVFNKVAQKMNDVVMGLGLFVIFGLAYIQNKTITEAFSILSIFAIAAYRFLPSVNRIMGSTLALKNGSYIAESLMEISNVKIETYKKVEPLKIQNDLKVNNLSFKYGSNDQNVLKGLRFNLDKGETIGFIGRSGSGKTTLLNIILRFLEENEGVLEVDNVRIDDFNKASFQKSIGYVQQNVFIKNGSLLENVAFGEDESEIDIERVHLAIKQSMLSAFVTSNKDGLKMELGESGVKISGGQKQRIGIARAIYKDAQILLFDEATSALDTETEDAIVKTINHLTTLDKTIIIVAHRLTTLAKCDRIYQMESGSISKIWQYEELIKSKIAIE